METEIPKNVEKILEKIAKEGFYGSVPTLETRKSDSLDFHEVSVWALKDALYAAYQAGFKSAKYPLTD